MPFDRTKTAALWDLLFLLQLLGIKSASTDLAHGLPIVNHSPITKQVRDLKVMMAELSAAIKEAESQNK